MRPLNNKRGRCTILVLILVTVAFEFVRSNVGTFSIVEGISMYPTFRPNDVIQTKTKYARSNRGDVVIITDNNGDRVIKRIIGLPGETVTLYRGFIYINNRRLREPYLPKFTYTFKSPTGDEQPEDCHLGDNQFFVMGDNRLESDDSRAFGPVELHRIHSVVSLPGNAPRPGFCDIILSETGKVMTGKPGPIRNQTRNSHQTSNAKI